MERYNPSRAPNPKQWLALSESERLELVAEYHADASEEIQASDSDEALERNDLHATMHVVVENQLAEGIEPVCEAVSRLIHEGLDRHDAVHAIGAELAGHLFDTLHHCRPTPGPEKVTQLYYERLRKLTAASWRARR
jgi:hypothetical protein